MCGRYALKTPPEILAALLHLRWMRYDLVPRYNIAPTQQVPVVRMTGEGERELVGMRWGLIPSWAKDASIGSKMINARSETAAEKPAFRQAFRSRRCVVPASGFYEWKKTGRIKQPHYIRRGDDRPLLFAGLWESWVDRETGECIDSCSILTKDANERLRELHDRMPVMLDAVGCDRWLDPSADDVAGLSQVLHEARDDTLVMNAVGTEVNSPRRDDSSLILPVETPSSPPEIEPPAGLFG